MDTENTEMNGLERFLIWFLVPVMFGVVLIIVLLLTFDVDVKKEFLSVANKIPIIEKWVPDTRSPERANGLNHTDVPTESDKTSLSREREVELSELRTALLTAQEEVKKLQSTSEQKAQELNKLQAAYDLLVNDINKQNENDESYAETVSETSKIFTGMTAGKAAAILSNMTMSEQVLLLSEMKTDEKTKILEKMDPKLAADVSILLKDVVPAKDRQIAALQERIKKLSQADKK